VLRTLLAWAALVVVAGPVLADQTITSSETVIHLTVQPVAAPKPALRYLLLPELKEMNPGNPIQGYLKCFMEQQKFFNEQASVERRDKLATMPLKELPAQDLLHYGGSALTQADYAARLDRPDWQILLKLKSEGVYLLLPDVQEMRKLAYALKVRFRAEVALGRFDDALRTAKTLFALARHLGEHPTFIGDLVGIAVANVAIGPLEEMLEQPGCPNLYWALTNLPSPLVRLDVGAEGERTWVLADFRDLPDDAPLSEEQLKRFIAHMDPLLRQNVFGEGKASKPFEGLRAWLDARNKDEKLLAAARRRLVEVGIPEERVRTFPADQVLLLDEERAYEVRRDEIMKVLNLPLWQAVTLTDPDREKKAAEKALFPLEPAISKVRMAQARLDQRIALLRCVEALRLYAAAHDGKLPAKLADCPVPLPDDPIAGKPFRYQLDGTTAHLRGTPPPGEEKLPRSNIHYEVTIQPRGSASR
jgi:hypothetical protein